MLKTIIFSAVTLILVGCGGGNDSSNKNNPPTEQLPPNKVESQLFLTENNQTTTLQATVETQDQKNPLYQYEQSFDEPDFDTVGAYKLNYNYYTYQFSLTNQANVKKTYIVGILYENNDLTKAPYLARLVDITTKTNPIEYECYSNQEGCKNITMSVDSTTGNSYATFNQTSLFDRDSPRNEIKLSGKISGSLSKAPTIVSDIQKSNSQYIMTSHDTSTNTTTTYNPKYAHIAFTNHNILEFWSLGISNYSMYIKTIDNKVTDATLDNYSNYFPAPKVQPSSINNIQFDPKTYTFNFNKVKFDSVLKNFYFNGQVGL